MKINHIAWLIAAAALSILALIGFQVNWMRHSRGLLEEQFNNRVNMALCSTVEKLAENQTCAEELRACCAKGDNARCDALLKQPEMASTLTGALNFYQIDLPYSVTITCKDSNSNLCTAQYSCSLTPILSNDSHQLQLQFQGKAEYLMQRMGLMITSSVAILGFICFIFGLAAYYLLRQKRMSDQNRDYFNHMTHEFRTPLTNIRLAGAMLSRKNPDLSGKQYLEIIRKECDQLTHQVENVLHLAGLEKGEYVLHKAPVDLKSLATEVVAGMDLQIAQRDAHIRLDPNAPACTISGDAFHLGNAFRNILDNSLKYSGVQPNVNIAFQAEEAGFRVRFSDNGIGLSAQDRRKIFRKFHRCNHALNTGEKGFGLGLAYVKKIVDMHRGHITVSSENGKGAQFDIYLPTAL